MSGTGLPAHQSHLACSLVGGTAPFAHETGDSAGLVSGTGLPAHQSHLACSFVSGTAPFAHETGDSVGLVSGTGLPAHGAGVGGGGLSTLQPAQKVLGSGAADSKVRRLAEI